ncbi:MAG: nucleotidyltransferase, partial [Clostridia bacterium]|nr:nucleotidyltransferase [Clostridia bacterium]
MDKNQSYWFAVGSNQKVYNSNNGVFVTKAKSAYDELNSAIKKSEGIETVLQKLFGSEQFSTPENRAFL